MKKDIGDEVASGEINNDEPDDNQQNGDNNGND